MKDDETENEVVIVKKEDAIETVDVIVTAGVIVMVAKNVDVIGIVDVTVMVVKNVGVIVMAVIEGVKVVKKVDVIEMEMKGGVIEREVKKEGVDVMIEIEASGVIVAKNVSEDEIVVTNGVRTIRAITGAVMLTKRCETITTTVMVNIDRLKMEKSNKNMSHILLTLITAMREEMMKTRTI